MSTRAYSEINLHFTWHVKGSLPSFSRRLWLRQPRSLGRLGQIARARSHFDRFCYLRIVSHRNLQRSHTPIGCRRQIESQPRLDKRTVAIELWSEGLPVGVFRDEITERLEHFVGDWEIRSLDDVAKFDWTI